MFIFIFKMVYSPCNTNTIPNEHILMPLIYHIYQNKFQSIVLHSHVYKKNDESKLLWTVQFVLFILLCNNFSVIIKKCWVFQVGIRWQTALAAFIQKPLLLFLSTFHFSISANHPIILNHDGCCIQKFSTFIPTTRYMSQK